jgi:hypothetical protein
VAVEEQVFRTNGDLRSGQQIGGNVAHANSPLLLGDLNSEMSSSEHNHLPIVYPRETWQTTL